MSKKQVEFFTFLIVICTVTAAAILIIDYQIKGAILAESNRMRRAIEGWERGQSTASANGNRSSGNSGNDTAYPADLVDSGTAGVEKTGPISRASRPGTARKTRLSEPDGTNGPGSVPGTGE
jgi:hypothetical protein